MLCSYVMSSLIHVAPRMAWVRLHTLPGSNLAGMSLRTYPRPDAECMARCGVPLQSASHGAYVAFKMKWLASAEGREWGKHEKCQVHHFDAASWPE